MKARPRNSSRHLPRNARRYFEQSEQAANRVEEFEREVKQSSSKNYECGCRLLSRLLPALMHHPPLHRQANGRSQFFRRFAEWIAGWGWQRVRLYCWLQGLVSVLDKAVSDYTKGAFDNYDKEDVAGLLKDRLELESRIWWMRQRPENALWSSKSPRRHRTSSIILWRI